MRRFLMFGLWIVCTIGFASPALADTQGQSQTFYVNPTYDATGATVATATLRAVGVHAYFYVDDRYWNALSSEEQSRFTGGLTTLATQFDTATYPLMTSLWGFENSPGIDGDPHVVILLQRLVSGSGGYFETIHNYTKDHATGSNAREMIYVNADSVLAGSGKSFIAHEFQHLISFNQKELVRGVQDDVWVNEARSEYSLTVAGFSMPFEGSTLQRRLQAFLRSPSDSLVEWPNTSTDYSIASLFVHYLSDRYGSDAIAFTLRTASAGVTAIDEWLSQTGKTERFADVFSDWMVASYLNDRGVDPRYGYVHDGLRQMHVAPVVSARLDGVNLRSDYSASLKEWQPLWVQNEITAQGITAVNVRVAGSTDAGWRGAAVARYRDGSSRVVSFTSVFGGADVGVAGQVNGSGIYSIVVVVSQGTTQPVRERNISAKPVTITISLGDITGAPVPVEPSPTPTPSLSPFAPLINGDLIRRTGQEEVYVIWGQYRRYLPQGVLKLYGFENRPVREVSDAVFLRYSTSNYIREDGQKKVYALWPDGTKHWMNITSAQWDATGRDWGAIFTINGSEVAWYASGPDVLK